MVKGTIHSEAYVISKATVEEGEKVINVPAVPKSVKDYGTTQGLFLCSQGTKFGPVPMEFRRLFPKFEKKHPNLQKKFFFVSQL